VDLYDELIQILRLFEREGVEYALCGGLAVAFYGYPRFTKDIDFLIPREELAEVKELLSDIGYDIEAGPIPFDVGKPTQREIHRVSKAAEELFTLDLMLVTDVFEGVFEQRELMQWKDITVQIVSIDGLATMKKLAGRTQDLLDLEKLSLKNEDEEA
jgi:hypothetical protein